MCIAEHKCANLLQNTIKANGVAITEQDLINYRSMSKYHWFAVSGFWHMPVSQAVNSKAASNSQLLQLFEPPCHTKPYHTSQVPAYHLKKYLLATV